jgi:hypothetical protein
MRAFRMILFLVSGAGEATGYCVPVNIGTTGARGVIYGTREKGDSREHREPAAAGRS